MFYILSVVGMLSCRAKSSFRIFPTGQKRDHNDSHRLDGLRMSEHHATDVFDFAFFKPDFREEEKKLNNLHGQSA